MAHKCYTIERITERGYYIAYAPDGTVIGQGNKLAKRYTEINKYAVDNDVDGEYTIVQPEVSVSLIAADDPIGVEPPNLPPQWNQVSNPNWTEGVGGTYDLAADSSDPEGDTLTYSLESGTLPSAVGLDTDTGLLTCLSTVTKGVRTGLVFGINDGTNAVVNSESITININAPAPDPDPPPDPPPGGGGGHRWNPGHYAKASGDPSATDQNKYWNNINADIASKVNDLDGQAVEIQGALVACAWGTINPTGNTFDWDRIDTVLDTLRAAGNKKLLLMILSKSFTSSPVGLQAPADLNGEIWVTPEGKWFQLWKESNMDRHIAALEEIINHYDNEPLFEGLCTQEPVPSFKSGTSPPGYNAGLLAAQLEREYTAMGVLTAATKTNFFGGNNHLATNTNQLLQSMFANNIGFMSPDAREVTAQALYRGENGADQDYRFYMPRFQIASNSAFSHFSGRDSADVLDYCQESQATHVAWITYDSAPSRSGIVYTWAQHKAAILADQVWNNACPLVYTSCDLPN